MKRWIVETKTNWYEIWGELQNYYSREFIGSDSFASKKIDDNKYFL